MIQQTLSKAKRIVLFFVFLMACSNLFAQNKGIDFLQNVSWQQIQDKAKAEHKFIFVDCFATWCGPCKWMDKNVYINGTVGDYLNGEFISVKVQMDSTDHDNKSTKNWYKDARWLEKEYKIDAYPSFVFFSPDGKIQYKEKGARDIKSFMSLVDSVKTSHNHYYLLLKEYQQGNKNPANMPYLISGSEKLGDDSTAKIIARDYIAYLNNLPEEGILTTENLEIIFNYDQLVDPDSHLFRLVYQKRAVIDSIMNDKKFSNILIIRVIVKKEIFPAIRPAINSKAEPSWDSLMFILEKKYDRHEARKDIFYVRSEFYEDTHNWSKLASSTIDQAEEEPNLENDPSLLNNYAFYVFDYSANQKELELALQWAKKSVFLTPQNASHLDTEANLLYKLGNKEEAIKMEKQAAQMDPNDKDIAQALQKMLLGTSTWKWPVENK